MILGASERPVACEECWKPVTAVGIELHGTLGVWKQFWCVGGAGLDKTAANLECGFDLACMVRANMHRKRDSTVLFLALVAHSTCTFSLVNGRSGGIMRMRKLSF